ncbi:MAG: phosphatidylglycerophosphatase A [Deltaproteobacteria bacterium]|nr:phosphatidylglycerophosphatase A [Deltaproteobacteria bacterium]
MTERPIALGRNGSWLLRAVASGLGAGFLPVAPGTWGTLVAMPVAWILGWLPPAVHGLLLIASLPAAAAVCGRAAEEDGRKDPHWITLDEVVGYAVTVAFVPARLSAYLAGFFLFRLFDILKPPPAGWVDRCMPGGWGVLLDDVLAGLYARLVLGLLVWGGVF